MDTFADVVDLLLGLVNSTIPLIFALTLMIVIWQVVKAWVIDAGDANSIDAGKRAVLVGVIALVCMVSLWGIIQILQSSLRLT